MDGIEHVRLVVENCSPFFKRKITKTQICIYEDLNLGKPDKKTNGHKFSGKTGKKHSDRHTASKELITITYFNFTKCSNPIF
jgi:hypothetical protein